MAQFSLHDVRGEIEREINTRRGAYEKWKKAGAYPNGKPVDRAALDAQLAKMEQAAKVVAWFEQHEEAIKWLFKHRSELKAAWEWWEKVKANDQAVQVLLQEFPDLELAEPST